MIANSYLFLKFLNFELQYRKTWLTDEFLIQSLKERNDIRFWK